MPLKTSSQRAMFRFKPTDAVFIIPKFAHLYPGNSAVVVSVKANQFRPMFNEYILEFADGSTASLFEFQIIEDVSACKTVIAAVTFDSRYQTTTTHTRGNPSSQRVILQTAAFQIDMRIRTEKSRGSIMGQILEIGTKNHLENVAIQLMREAVPITRAVSDSLGVFEFINVPRGSLNILVPLPQHASRIFGTFSI
jgi:hypothetical protein